MTPYRDQQSDLERRLRDERPLPRPAFRGELRRHLMKLGQSGVGRPKRLRFLILTYASSGAALLVIAAAGVAGAGPLAS